MSTRTALIASGVVLTAAGGALAAGGVVLGAFGGTDGTLSTGTKHHETTANAVVSDEGDLGGSTNLAFGDPTLKVSVSDSDQPVFVGIGPTEDVDRFLAGATVQTVSDFDLWPLQLDTETREGNRQPGSPLDETFWVAQSDGATSAAASWKIDDGSYRVVVMNADGSPGVGVDGSLVGQGSGARCPRRQQPRGRRPAARHRRVPAGRRPAPQGVDARSADARA